MADKLGASAIASLKRIGRFAIVAGMGLSLSACAQGGLGQLVGANAPTLPKANIANAGAASPAGAQTELAKATEYWGKKFASSPRNAKFAVNYARNLKAMGQKRRALAVLQQASIFNGKDTELASEYGRLALELGQTSLGAKILARVDNPSRPDWRIISARGTALAKQGRNGQALAFFERASVLAPNKPSIMNNLAMAYIMDGQLKKAEPLLRKAVLIAKPKHAPRIQQNLSLVLGLQGKYDEAKSISAKQIGVINASANVSAIRKLVKLKPQLSPAAKADQLIQLAKTAETKNKIASAKTKGRKTKTALRRTTIGPAPTAPKVKASTLAQNAPLKLRSKTLY